jgi:hypothetical protein
LALAAAMLVAGSVHAEPTPSELALARRLFAEAGALEASGDWKGAAVKLREALAIKETPGLRYHLAHCEEQSGALVAASLEYARASELIAEGAQAPDVAQLLALADQRLAARIPKLVLRVPPDIKGASIEIDGQTVSPVVLTNAVPLDPGEHRVVARAPNRAELTRSFTLNPGQTLTVELTFAPAAPAAAAAPASTSPPAARPLSEPERSEIAPRTLALAGEGVLTISGLALGIGFAVVRSRASDRVAIAQRDVDLQSSDGNAACQGASPAPSCAKLREALDDHQNATVLTTVGFIGAGVGATAGILTWLLWPSAETDIALDAAPGSVNLRVGGRF